MEMKLYQGRLEAAVRARMIFRVRGRSEWQHAFSQCQLVAQCDFINEVLQQTRQR